MNTNDVLRDVEYARPDGQALRLDLYRPALSTGLAPVIVWIHGGDWRGYDWVRGSKSPCPMAAYSKKGYAVASVEYRLAPRACFPGPLIDCKAAVRWLRANAARLGLDTERIAVWGAGGGALLANLVGATSHLAEFEQGDHLEFGSQVAAVVDCNGKHYLYWGENTSRSAFWITGYFNAFRQAQLDEAGIDDEERAFLGGSPNSRPELALKASPATYVSSTLPPILLLTGTESRIHAFVQRTSYVKELRAAGADVTILYLNDVGYGGGALYDHPVVDAFLAWHLKGVSLPARAGLNKINTCGRLEPLRSFERFFDEDNGVMITSSSTRAWDNPIKGFAHPLVRRKRFFSKAAGSDFEYLLYLPPSYDRDPARRYPVLYLMPTGSQTVDDCALNFVELIHAAASSASCPEMIVVVPNSSFIAMPKPFGYLFGNRSERVLRQDFIPHVDATYRTVASPRGRALQCACGGSMDNLAFALRPAEPLFSLVSIVAPLHHWTLMPLFRRRRKALGADMLLELYYDERDAHGVGASSLKLIEALRKMGARFEPFLPSHSGVHIWHEFLVQFKGNAFARWAERFGRLDPRLATVPLPEGVRAKRDLAYGKCGDRSLTLDLYLPAEGAVSLPIVVWLHGADWRGNLWNDESKRPCPLAALAARGYAVASVECSLAAEEPFPGQVRRCQEALRWLRERAEEYALDASAVALCGESAGGALASLTALFAPDNPTRAPSYDLKQDLGVRAVVCCGAPFDLSKLDAMRWRDSLHGGAFQGHPTSGVSKFLGGKRPSFASAISYVHRGAPPHLLVHGSEDTVVSPRQSGLMHRALLEKGAASRLMVVDGGGHGFATLREGAETTIEAFLDARLKGDADRFAKLESGLQPRVNALGSSSWDRFKDPIARETLDARYRVFYSAALGEELSFLVSEPPLYATMPDASYPVILLFPDQDETPRDYLHYAQMRRDAIYAEAAPEAILVVVNAAARDSYLRPERHDLLERMVVEELLPYVETHWRARRGAAARLLEGFGQGANAAARIAFGNPELFGGVSLVGPAEEPEGMRAAGVASRLARNAGQVADQVAIRIVDTSQTAHSTRCASELKQLLEASGVRCRSERSALPIEDRLVALVEADFEPFGFHADCFGPRPPIDSNRSIAATIEGW